MRSARRNSLLAAILAGGLLLRLGAGFLRPPAPDPMIGLPNQDEYSEIAASFADLGTLMKDGTLTAHREPGYPVLLGLAFLLLGKSYWVILVLNSLTGTAMLFGLYWVGKRLFDEQTGFITAAIGALYPVFIYYSAQPLRETLMAANGVLCVYALLKALDAAKPKAFIWPGLAAAWSALTNSTFLPFTLFGAPLSLLWLWRKKLPLAARSLGVYFAVFMGLYALWPLRNHIQFGQWLLGSTAGAGTIFYVYQVVPQEAGGTEAENAILGADPVMREARAISDPITREKFMFRAGLAKLKEDPGAFFARAAWRLLWDQWRPLPRPRSLAEGYRLAWWLSLLSDGWIIPMALAGLVLWRLKPPEAVFPVLLVASTNAAYALILSMLRYRVSIMPWVILFAAFALRRLWAKAGRVSAWAALPMLLGVGPASAADKDVFGPMQAEMKRATAQLSQDAFGPPYFTAYRLVEEKRYEAAASYGAILQESEDAQRTLFVEVRFGSRTLDNTELGYQGWRGPAGDSPETLRQNLWLLTDGAYKNAVAGFLEKKARRATEMIPDVLDDFSVEEPAVSSEAGPDPRLEKERARELLRSLSAVMRRHPQIIDGRVSARLKWGKRTLLTSEGTRLATPDENVPSSLRVGMMTRAGDGLRLDTHKSWTVRRLSDLPPEAELKREVDQLAVELGRLREAPLQAPMAAPAILDPEFTGVLFHEALGHKLEGQRQRDRQQSQVFKELVGKRIIPEHLSLIDDPTLAEFQGEPLHGFYRYDSEGVKAQRVVLVDRGILREFLMSRWPVKGFSRSNGHGRSDAYLRPTGRMTNLIVRAEEPLPRPELTKRLLELVRKAGKPYGFILSGAMGGENPNSRDAAQTLEVRPRLVYRVDAQTGEKTLVRGVSLVGTPLVVLNRIVAAGDDMTLANGFVCGAESGFVPVAQIAPSVLLSEVELQRLPEDRARVPILKSPFFIDE